MIVEPISWSFEFESSASTYRNRTAGIASNQLGIHAAKIQFAGGLAPLMREMRPFIGFCVAGSGYAT
jgi:hypothetical protein